MSGETILIVEDHVVLRDGWQAMLENEGYRVITADHGLEALEKMRAPGPASGSPPDMILSDIVMPEMDGYAFLEAVRSRPEWVSIPFVFLTARREREDLFAGKLLGAEDYLTKPVTRQDLLGTIQSRLTRSQQLLLVQLQEAYDGTLIMLANAIEQRDAYTSWHVERVQEYSWILARQMACSPASMLQIHYGSILHDVGKIQIPKQVLNKPGPLTLEEWELMKKHPSIGAEMIRNIPYLSPAIPVIQSHHERWDGSGYPHGLAGEDIPLAARIVAVADSLDAITSARTYRRCLTPLQAQEEILQGDGTLYDPAVLSAFRCCWNEILTRMTAD
jgi:putative two-component system response regulator